MPLQASDAYYLEQQDLAVTTAAAARRVWSRMDDDFDASWRRLGPAMLETVQLGRAAAAQTSVAVTEQLISESGMSAPATASVNPAAFVIAAPDGRSMESLLSETVIKTKVAVQGGADVADALSLGGRWLTAMVLTVMADTGRGVVQADMTARPAIAGYIRVLNGTSCPRCVILAGKWFRWNSGFLRHPRCDCRHVPAADQAWAKAEGFVTDPYEYFHSLSPSEQERVWGRSEARAIRAGADIYRVENIRLRGLATAKGAVRFGTPSRMTVDDIFKVAGTRKNAIALLEREGYITGPQVGGGNVIGLREGFGALGKGGNARAASNAVLDARASGVRDPLNRYTMTAAERRLYDANYRLNEARLTGNRPGSVGANSADKFTRPRPLAPGELARLERELQVQLNAAKAKDAPESLKRLAKLLGLI